MNVARVCKLIPSAQPHEFFGYRKDSLDGMLLTIALMTKVVQEDNVAAANTSGNNPGAAGRLAKHLKNK